MRSFDDRDNSGHGWSVFLTGACLGAAGMYLLDPGRGARRRGVIRDQVIHAVHTTADGLDAAGRDLAHRAQGTWAAAQSRFRSTDVPDHILIERVRAKLGRWVSHPRAIEVDAADGRVLLRGKILKREVDALLSAVRAIPGVHEIDDLLERHETAGNIPSLRGGASRPGNRSEFMQREWSPAARALACSIGSALVAYAAARRAVDLQKTITVHAPLATVFEYWANFENFPQFMTHVREVRGTNVEGQTHWIVAGPAHVPIEFDAVITQFVPNEVIAWKTVEGAPVAHAGIVRFQPDANGTRVHIRFSYNPPAGAIGHTIAGLLGTDPKSMMDADLARMKTLIETGHPPRDAAQPMAHAPDSVM